ncbi:TRAP transporter small permease [Thermodesulfobacteriota bacterium]
MHISLSRISNQLAWVEEQLLKVGLGLITCVVVTQVISRNLGYYIPWLGDVAVLSFTWMAFIGAALAIHNGSDFIIDVWGDKRIYWKRGLYIIGVVGTVIFIIFLFWQGIKWTLQVRGRVSGAGEISTVYYSISVPIGSLLSLFHLIETTVGWIREEKKRA